MNERRAKLRADTAVLGRAAFAGAAADVHCVALNFSPIGACVMFPSGTPVPRHFELALGLEPAASSVRVVWRREDVVGVAFVASRAVPDVIPG